VERIESLALALRADVQRLSRSSPPTSAPSRRCGCLRRTSVRCPASP